MINEASRHTDRLSVTEIRQMVQEREKIATTLVSDNIAFPHAVKQNIDESLIVLGGQPRTDSLVATGSVCTINCSIRWRDQTAP